MTDVARGTGGLVTRLTSVVWGTEDPRLPQLLVAYLLVVAWLRW